MEKTLTAHDLNEPLDAMCNIINDMSPTKKVKRLYKFVDGEIFYPSKLAEEFYNLYLFITKEITKSRK